MAKADQHATPAPDIPSRVPLEAALNFLHDGDPAALTAPLTERYYDRRTLDNLRNRLAQSGARLYGRIDHGPLQQFEAAEILGFVLEYETLPVLSGGLPVDVITPMSKQKYFDPAKRLCRHALRNVQVETTLLLKLLGWQALPENAEPKTKHDRVIRVLVDLDGEHRLKDDMRPSQLAKMVRPACRKRWPEDSEASIRVIKRAYDHYRLAVRPPK
jgi:hypothetical protein